MRSHRAASRYAKSLLVLAREQGVLEKVMADMQLFLSALDQSRQLDLVLKNPIVNNDKKSKILHALFDKRMDKLTLAAFDLITRKNRDNILCEIAGEFIKQYNDLKGLQEAEVITTIPIEDDLRQEFAGLVKKISGKEARLREVVNEDIVGGFILNVGDRRLDNSLRSQLNKIKRELTN